MITARLVTAAALSLSALLSSNAHAFNYADTVSYPGANCSMRFATTGPWVKSTWFRSDATATQEVTCPITFFDMGTYGYPDPNITQGFIGISVKVKNQHATAALQCRWAYRENAGTTTYGDWKSVAGSAAPVAQDIQLINPSSGGLVFSYSGSASVQCKLPPNVSGKPSFIYSYVVDGSRGH